MIHHTPLPTIVTYSVTVDPDGFLRLGAENGVTGVCFGRLVVDKAVTYLEVKDRNAARSLARGAQLLRVPVEAVIAALKSVV